MAGSGSMTSAGEMKRPYCAEYEARLPALLRSPREMKVFEPLRADYVFREESGTGLSSRADRHRRERHLGMFLDQCRQDRLFAEGRRHEVSHEF